MEINELKVEKTARYIILNPQKSPSRVLLALHGYGHLAEYFAQNFKILESLGFTIVVPEALSRFYIKGHQGMVGASWMTSYERLTEIDDYNAYLDTLMESLEHKMNIKNSYKCLLGFSQGAATACRWLAASKPQFDSLVLWGGLFPEDIDYSFHKNSFEQLDIWVGYGIKDPFRDEEKIKIRTSIFTESGLNYKEFSFEGSHTIDSEYLKTLLQDISKPHI